MNSMDLKYKYSYFITQLVLRKMVLKRFALLVIDREGSFAHFSLICYFRLPIRDKRC